MILTMVKIWNEKQDQIMVMFYLIISWDKFWNQKCWFIITDAEVDQVLHGKRNCKMTEKDGSID